MRFRKNESSRIGALVPVFLLVMFAASYATKTKKYMSWNVTQPVEAVAASSKIRIGEGHYGLGLATSNYRPAGPSTLAMTFVDPLAGVFLPPVRHARDVGSAVTEAPRYRNGT